MEEKFAESTHAPGFLRCMMANRCSYAFDFHGPSYTLDTGCSSSFVTLANAFEDLKEGRIDAALLTSGELCLSPHIFHAYLKSGIVSPTGESNPFDARANGMVRSEAAVAFFLQKASRARRVYATVVDIKQSTTGFVHEGVYVPSQKAEAKLFRDILERSGLTTEDIQFVEAHGTGTPVGDPIEMRAMEEVYCTGRDKPLYTGSVKSNLGHSEASAGQTGALKAIFAFETGWIAPNRDFKVPNPNCEALLKGTVKVVSEPLQLGTPYIAVNSFGFGGSIVQAVLKRNPIEYPSEARPQEIPRLVLYPATTEEAVFFAFEYVEKHPELRDEFFALLNKLSFCPVLQKPFRGYALFQNERPVVSVKNALREKRRDVWFVMTGMGCQWPGMGLGMMKIEAFAESMRRSAEVLKPLGIDLLDLLREDGNHLTTDRSITPAFVTIAAIQIALVDLLRMLGIQPDGIIGHSTGEMVSAYADGCCTAEQTILSAYWRGKCVESSELPTGAMAAVGLTWEEVVRRCPEGVYAACHNAEDSVTISGDKEALEAFVEELTSQNVFARVVNAYSYAFHCKHIWPASSGLRAALNEIIAEPKPRSEKWISTSYPEEEWDKEDCKLAGVEYFVHNLTSTVHFSDMLKKIPSDAVVIEIGPHFLLQSILKRSIGAEAAYFGLMKRNHPNNVEFFLESLGKLYQEGLNPNFERLYRRVKFPVPRGTPFISDLIRWDHSQSFKVPKWVPSTTSCKHQFQIASTDSYLLDHFIDGKPLFPAAGFLVIAWQALAKNLGKKEEEVKVAIENFKIHRPTLINPGETLFFETNIMDINGKFHIMNGSSLVATGKIYELKNVAFSEPPPALDRESTTYVSAEDIYNELRISGYEYGPAFRSLVEVSFDGKEGVVDWNDRWIPFLDALLLFFMFSKENSSFVLPTGALSIKVVPDILRKAVEKNLKENITGLPVNFHAHSNICRTEGVKIRSLEVDSAPQQVKPDSCIFEEYRFVPYEYNYYATGKNQDLEKYMIACNKLIDTLQSKTNRDLSRGKFQIEQRFNFDVEEYISGSSGEHVLLSTLKSLSDIDISSSVLEIQDLAGGYIKGIGKEIANTLLLREYFLRLVFDVISENSYRRINVLEILNGFAPILPIVVERIENYSLLKFKTKSLVCKSEQDVHRAKIRECNIQLYTQKDSSSVVKDKTQAIVVSAICTNSKEEARQHVRLLSSTVEEKGFIVLYHKTSILPPENLLMILSGQTIHVVPSSTLEKWFKEEDLEIISKISDNICGCLYLLRHEAKPSPVKVISVTKDAAWFDDLKSGICDASETLWVVSEDKPDSGVVGMVNCLRLEPGGEKIRCVYIPSKSKEENIPPLFSFEDPFYRTLIKRDLVMNVYKRGAWGSLRHSKVEKELQTVKVDNSFVNIRRYGDLSSFVWMESALNYLEVPDRSLVHIYYSSLNFRDVMLATGKLSLSTVADLNAYDNCLLGVEFAGRNKYGERVAGFCKFRGLASATVAIPEMLLSVPDEWSLEEAATVPVVYSTCYNALIMRGRLRPRESILIHSGTGGIGLAAINIALSMDCEIFTTVGTEEKRRYLLKNFPRIKEENVGCSRDTTFENMIMKRTNGKGVDVVLNSLAEDKFLASIRCVTDNGRFLEIGKYDLSLDRKIGLKFFLKNISFHAVCVDHLLATKIVSDMKEMQLLLMEGIKSGVVKPLDRTVFQRDEVEKAFRYMAKGKHIGKVIVKIRDEEKEKFSVPKRLRLPSIPVTYFYSHKVYIIVGGLGGFGIEVCKWLASKGARNIVLTSRYGARTPYHHFCLKRWKEQGYVVKVSTRNVAVKEEAAQLLKEVAGIGPVGGIFNSAAVLRDSFLENMDLASFQEVCAPKADATKHLDVLSRSLCPELDHFVCFSSISCGRGNAGQMNYGYANSVMERICEQRREVGLPGLAIQWGIIGDVGVVHRHMGDDAMIAGVRAQRVKSCLEILNISCQLEHPVLCSYVVKDSSTKTGDRGDTLQRIARIFGLKDLSDFNSVRSFGEMGVDSMIGIELKKILDSSCDANFSVKEIQDMRIEDVNSLLEKAESRKKAESGCDSFVSTASASLPKSFTHPESVERLNAAHNGIPVFVLDIDSSDLEKPRVLGRSIKQPAFALVLTKDAPLTDVSSLASWFIKKVRETTPKEAHVVAYGTSSVVALEMILQSQKTQNGISKLVVLDGVSQLMESLNGETKRCETDIFCRFVELHIPSARNRIGEQLSNAAKFDQKLRIVADLFTKSSKETVNSTELSNVVTAHLKKLQILENYSPEGKVKTDLTIVEDSSKLLANDVAEVKKLLTEACTGKVIIKRVPDLEAFTEEAVRKIAVELNEEPQENEHL